MKKITRTGAGWLMTGGIAITALFVGAKDAAATPPAHSLSAAFNNPNAGSSACSHGPNGGPLRAYVDAEASSNPSVTLCSVSTFGMTTDSPTCPMAANTWNVWVQESTSGITVSGNTFHNWSSGTQTADYVQSGCQTITSWGTPNP
jgi:hypothetical protein